MACQILVSNQSGMPKAEIISIVDSDHVWSTKESMQSFLGNGGLFDDWSRTFSVVIILDKAASEIGFLNDRGENMLTKWVFLEPPRDTQEWIDLYLTGEVSRTWSAVGKYLVER